jgi:hypothetical protein
MHASPDLRHAGRELGPTHPLRSPEAVPDMLEEG